VRLHGEVRLVASEMMPLEMASVQTGTQANEWKAALDETSARLAVMEDCRDDAARAWGRVETLNGQIDTSKARIAELSRAAAEHEREALALSRQLHEVLAEHALGKRRLHDVEALLEATTAHLTLLQRAAAQERSAIVHSALASLHHMHGHVASASGYAAPGGVPRTAGTATESADSALLPFQSHKWWSVYGASAREGRGARVGPPPRTAHPERLATATASDMRQWEARPVADRFHPASRRAAWHEHRPVEERAARALGGINSQGGARTSRAAFHYSEKASQGPIARMPPVHVHTFPHPPEHPTAAPYAGVSPRATAAGMMGAQAGARISAELPPIGGHSGAGETAAWASVDSHSATLGEAHVAS
jgi:hypothetical protein